MSMLLETLPMPLPGVIDGAASNEFSWPSNEADARDYLRRARGTKRRLLCELEERAQVSPRHGKRFSRQVLSDRRVIAATILQECKRKGDDVGQPGHTSCLSLLYMAWQFNAWASSNEPVRLIERDRSNAKTRWTASHGIYESVRNTLSREIALRLVKLHPRQFILQGGAPKLRGWLRSALPDAAAVMTTDFPACFDTLRRSSIVSGLPLPRRVMEAALFETKDRAIPLVRKPNGKLMLSGIADMANTVGVSLPGRGISMGAALSSVASEVVIAEVIHEAEKVFGVVGASHGDNLIFLLNDAAQKLSLENALTSAAVKHFGLDVIAELTRRIRYDDPVEGFLFCGKTYAWRDGDLRCRTEPARIEHFMIRAEVALGEATTTHQLDTLVDSLKGWAVQNADTPGAIFQAIELAQKIATERADLSAKVDKTAYGVTT